MKKILSFLGLAFLPTIGFCASGPVTVFNSSAVAFSTVAAVNLQSYVNPQTNAGKLAAQVTYSSATLASKTFTGGQVSTGSITVASANILKSSATDRITVPATSLILASASTAQITISSAIAGAIVTVNGYQLIEGDKWNRGTSSTTAARSLSAAINTYMGAFRSTHTYNVVYATSTATGQITNTYTLTSSTTGITVTTFRGGRNPALYDQWISFNGTKVYNGYGWTDASGTSTGTAASIASWLNSFGVIRAAAANSVVFATATVAGAAGNAFTLSASTTNLTVLSAAFTGGQNSGYVTVNGRTYTAGVDFSTGTTAATATSLAAAINATSATYGVTAAAQSSVVRTTSTIVGSAANYTVFSSTQAALVLSAPFTASGGTATGTMTGGSDSGITNNSANITVTAHGFTTALPVLYSGTPAIGGLTTGTTYFAVVVSANVIKLSSTSAVAQTGNGIVITSSQTLTSANTYTLAPLAFSAGTASGKWEVSNDGVNWADYTRTALGLNVSSNTFTAVYPSSTVVQDFGYVDYGWMRYNIVGPTQGGVNLKVLLNSKD